MSSLKELPEFASLCSFIQLFGEELNVTLSHSQLAKFLEIADSENVPKIWIDIHRRLLGRIKYRCSIDKWEGTLKKCLINVLGYESALANLNGTNYFGISAEQRAKILNILFDCQFDKNVKFKEKVNLKLISELRTQPFGSDIHGCVYWLFVDLDISVIMYKENLEEESFKIVAESLEDLNNILKELSEIDCEKVNLSQLYSVNSPSDDIDHSRNQSPILDNISGILEKATNKLIPIKMENNDLSKGFKSKDMEIIIDYSANKKIAEETPPNLEEVLKVETDVEKVKSEICVSESNANENLNENEINNVSPEKNKKKLGRKPKEISSCNEDEANTNIGLRRSERKRKPVNLFSISYTDSCKKLKRDTPKTEDHSSKKIKQPEKKLHKKSKEKRKKGRPKKSTDCVSETVKELEKKLKKNKNRHEKGKKHKKHKRSKNPWENAESSEDHNEVEEDDEVYLNEESEGSISIKETWDDKPESDFDPDKISFSSDEETSKARGRNYFRQKSIKKEKNDLDDKPCQICLKNNIPEMILLCDDCDLGHHAMCLKPSLMIIPEGDWFCPKCQHKKLVSKLSERISELEKSMVKNTAKMRMQERLNFVNISMSNILSKSQERKQLQKSRYESADTGSITDCNSTSGSLSSSSGSCNSSDNSSESGSKATRTRYKFRETSRKENTKYNFEEIDKIFDDALEHDEKYKQLKREQGNRDNRKHSESSRGEESEPEYDYSGIEPRKKSSGKDMANIVNEEEGEAEQLPNRPMVKKKRLKYISDDDYEDDIKDTDFKLSDQSDSEFDEYECAERNASNCSDDDDDWVVSRKRVTRKSSKKKNNHRSIVETSGGCSRPRRNAARNINYRNMLGDEDEDEDEENSAQSHEHDSSEGKNKPPPVVSRRKDKHTNAMKKRIISDSEYEENSKSESIADSGSTEKLEVVKRKLKPDLNSDSEEQEQVTEHAKVTNINNEEDNESNYDNSNDLIIDVKSPPIPSNIPVPYPPLGILNPMRAKADEDDDVENEVESETECDLTISMNNQNTAPKV